jgi:hypothetical protein
MIGDFVEAVRVQLGVAADIWLTGAFHLGANGAPPRYVWVPVRDAIEGADISNAFAARTPKALLTRVAGLECHAWGDTLANTEAMVHNVVSASHAVLGANARFGGVRWEPESLNANGFLAVVSIGVPIPITAGAIELTVTTGTFDTIECNDTPPATPDGYVECCEEIDP